MTALRTSATAQDKAAGGVRAGSANVAARGDVDRLQSKAVGLTGVLFLTMTGAAPISAMLLNVPVAVGNGNGIGAPAAYLVATIILLIFSVGYAAMAKKVTAVGRDPCASGINPVLPVRLPPCQSTQPTARLPATTSSSGTRTRP